MSVQAISWAMYGAHGHLDPVSRFVLTVYADHANADGVAWPSLDRVARTIGASVDTVRRRLTTLTDAGLLTTLNGDDPRLPAAWHELRADRRPTAYALAYTGSQPATPSTPRGSRPAATGSQQERHGVATVRPEPRTEPRTEPARATAPATPPPRPQQPRPCTACHHFHKPEEPHLRRQPPAVARQGAARAIQALQEARA